MKTLEDRFTGSVSPVLQRLAWSGREIPPPDQLASLPPGPDVGVPRLGRPEGQAGSLHPVPLEEESP